MSHFPGSRQAEDVATRYEVPIGQTSLATLFKTLSGKGDEEKDTSEDAPELEYTVERLGLESVFLKVIREGDIVAGEKANTKRRWKFW
jgi:ATP-binding cassette subfamily A (ABC1) protein 3